MAWLFSASARTLDDLIEGLNSPADPETDAETRAHAAPSPPVPRATGASRQTR
jgi:hypothetical protein